MKREKNKTETEKKNVRSSLESGIITARPQIFPTRSPLEEPTHILLIIKSSPIKDHKFLFYSQDDGVRWNRLRKGE